MWTDERTGLFGDHMARQQETTASRHALEKLIQRRDVQKATSPKFTPSSFTPPPFAPPPCLCGRPLCTAGNAIAAAEVRAVVALHRLQIGAVSVTMLTDGAVTCPASWMFPALSEAERAAAWPDGQASLSFGCVLLQATGLTILLDTSLGCIDPPIGPQMKEARPQRDIRELLKQAGVTPDDVDVVCHSHLHRDHTGWNVVLDDNVRDLAIPLFRKAKHLVQRAEYAYWTSAEQLKQRIAYTTNVRPLEQAGMLTLIDGTHEICPGVQLQLAPGHTPGHQVCVIRSEGASAYFIGDLLHTLPQVAHPEWSPVFDWGSSGGVSGMVRRAVLGRIADEDAMLLSPHLPFPGAGTIKRTQVDGHEVMRYVPEVCPGEEAASCVPCLE